jgi:hypothetical protein
MPLPDHLADLERKVSARLDEALAEMRRAVEAGAQRASSALLADLDGVRPLAAGPLVAEQDLLDIAREERGAARRELASSLRLGLLELDRARTQSAVLAALLASARPFGERAALWLMRPHEILGWASVGFADPGGDRVAGRTVPHSASPALERLAEGRGGVLVAGAEASELASALEIPAPKQAVLVPLVLRDRLAAALYVDSADSIELEVAALQLLAVAAAQRLELQALSTRSFTPTLFLDTDGPASERGLALWDPGSAVGEPAVAPAAAAPEIAWRATTGESPRHADSAHTAHPFETVADAADAADASDTAHFSNTATTGHELAAGAAPSEALPAAPDDEHDTLSDAMTRVASGVEVAFPGLPAPAASEIAWQMEEAEETAFLGGAPHRDLMDELRPLPDAGDMAGTGDTGEGEERDRSSRGTPTLEIPLAAPAAADLAATDWRETDETTAPHSTFSAAATQMFPTPGAMAHEIPPSSPSSLASSATAASNASTIAFVPPDLERAGDLTEDATVMIQRSAFQSAPPLRAAIPPLPPATEIEPPEERTHPSMGASALPDDEPTVSRAAARTTEVVAPPDLQGPGWAFTSTRSPRGSSENALHEEARRLARLLVSEIKLYNEDQVEEGRHNRDIYHRLKEDIDRSRQIYEERVHESVRGTTDYFQQELVRSLAGGDPRALGI